MNFKKFRTSVFVKYILSYTVILLIPIIVISFIIQVNVFNTYKKEIESKEKAALLNNFYTVENQFNSCSKIVDQLMISNNLSPFTLKNNTTKGIELIKTLMSYQVTNNFFEHVIVHFFDDDYIFSERSSYTKESFFQVFNLKNTNPKELMNKLSNISDPIFISNVTFIEKDIEKNYILYAFPLTYGGTVKGFVSFFIDNNKCNMLLGNNTYPEQQSFILDSKYNIINDIKVSDNVQPLIKDAVKKLKDSNEEIYTIKSSTIFAAKLDHVDMSYISVISNKKIYTSLIAVQYKTYGGLLLAILLGALIIYKVMKITYNPIRQLKNFSNSIHTTINEKEINDFEAIKSTLNYFYEKNHDLEEEIEKNLPIKQSFLLNQLVNGNIVDKDNFLKECSKNFITLTAPYHTIVTIKSPLKITDFDEILDKIKTDMMDITYSYLIQRLEPDLTIFIIGSESSQIKDHTNISLPDKTSLSLGTPYKDILNIPKSYLESITSIDTNESNSSRVIIYKEILTSTTKKLLKSYDDIIKSIKEHLLNENVSELKEDLTHMLVSLDKEKLPIELLRKLYFEIILLFNLYFEKNKNIIEYKNIDLKTLYDIEDIESLKEVFVELINEMVSLIDQKAALKLPTLSIDKILTLINENYADYAFSLQVMAKEFDVSVSYLSQYFKDKTNSTILDYITDLKMDKAKELLTSSSLSLKDVAEQIGYVNVSSFIRRFKQVTGMTPGEYKKSHN